MNRLEVSFSFLGDDDFFQNDIRARADGDPLGCIGDLGWYCVRIALLVFGKLGYGKAQTAQVPHCQRNRHGVPLDATCIVHFQEVKTKESDETLACTFVVAKKFMSCFSLLGSCIGISLWFLDTIASDSGSLWQGQIGENR